MESLPSSRLVDVCNKLISGNVLMQYQALSRANTIITDLATNEVEKKRTLLKLIDSLRLIKSKNCCLALLKILLKHAKESSIDHHLLINTFLGLINSKAENSSYCLEFISELLIHFRSESVKYSMRNPTHPFVDVLRNSNESDLTSRIIYEQINFILEDKRIEWSEAYKLLRPVFIYIFMETNNLKHLMANLLLKKLEFKMDSQLVDLVNFYFNSLKKKDYKDVLLFESIFKLVELFSINEMIHDKIKINGLILLMIDIETTGYCNLTSYWNALSKLFSNNKQLIDSELMEILAANISKISFSSLESYLHLVETCICKYNAQKTELCNFLPSLFLNVMSLSHVESIEPLNSCRLVITDLISKIEKKALTAQNFPCKLPSKDIFNLAEYEDLDESNHDPNERINMYLFNRLSSQFLIDDNTYEIHCSIFKKIVSKWPHLYPTIYCLFIYKIKSSTNCDVINYILDSMTDLISTKVDINLCLNTFRSLMSSSNGEGLIVKLVCMKQLTKLCTLKYDYLVYPHLSNELVSIRSLQLAENERLEVLYMKAYCINRIIRYRPDYYAQELLATISNLLNQCVHPNDEGICAILLDTISYLCESEVVDMMSTWTALLPQFNLEKRVLTLNAFCRFMSVAARLKHLESDNENSFYFKMMQNLWTMSDPMLNSNENKWLVIGAALGELSKFDKSTFKCSLLPNFVQEKLKERNKKLLDLEENKEKSINEIFSKIPSLCYMDYFESLEPEAYPGLAPLFDRMLSTEIDSIPRRSISFAKEKIFSGDEQLMSKKYLNEHLKKFLTDEYTADLAELDAGQNLEIGYILYSYEPHADRNLEGKIAKKHIKSYWKNYEKTLALILRKGKFDINEDNLYYFANGFNNFVKRSYHACIQALNLEYSSELDEKTSNDPKIRNKLVNTWNLARDKHLEILTQSLNQRTGDPNADLFTIVLNSLVLTTMDYVMNNFATDEDITFNQRKWLEVLVDFILNIKENKTATESEYITMFSYKQSHTVDALKFLFKIYKESTLLNWFMASVLPSCVKIKINSFLIKYIDRIELEIFSKETLQSNDILSLGVYLKNLIYLENNFRIEQNDKINAHFCSLLEKFKNQIDHQPLVVECYLNLFVQCLSALYHQESIYYDDTNILISLIRILNQKKDSLFYDLHKNSTSSMVNLNCLAYKANLIKNEQIFDIYELLNKESRFSDLLALFCRFLVSYGFYESVEWIEQAFSKWSKFYADFKLNLETDSVELENSIKGILTLLSGVSVNYINFDQDTFMPIDMDKLLKPESTIKDLMKFLKQKKYLVADFKPNLGFIVNRFEQAKYAEIYSTPNTYDYLDDFFLLKHVVNELLRLSKIRNPTPKCQMKFEFFFNVLLDSCLHSKCKILPPLNWYYFMTSLIKSKFGTELEPKMIKLTLMQINNLNSAYSLVKNFLVDTHSFYQFKNETQMIVLEHLVNIFDRFNLILNHKLISKLKYFLDQKSSNRLEFISCVKIILTSLLTYIKRSKGGSNEVLREVVNFFLSLSKDHYFNPDLSEEKKILDIIVDVMEAIEDHELIRHVIKFEEALDNKFLMNFYLRTRLVVDQYQPFSLINESISLMVEQLTVLEMLEDNFKVCLLKLMSEFLLDINFKVNGFQKDQHTDVKKINLMNSSLNWLMEFLNILKNADKNHQFLIMIFSVIVYAWSLKAIDLYDKKIHSHNTDSMLQNFDQNLKNFLQNQFWRQISSKLIEWLINISINKQVERNYFDKMSQSLMTLFKQSLIEENIWFKYEALIENKILSE